jgi:hypothetical protein
MTAFIGRSALRLRHSAVHGWDHDHGSVPVHVHRHDHGGDHDHVDDPGHVDDHS